MQLPAFGALAPFFRSNRENPIHNRSPSAVSHSPGTDNDSLLQKLRWQHYLCDESWWRWVLMATKRTKPGSEDRAIISQMVLDGMRSGLSAFKACQAAGVPQSTFSRWVDEDAILAENYTRAREDLIERMAQEVLELSDSDVGFLPDGKKDWAAVQKHKLQVDTRKWLLSKLAPKKYGEKLEVSGDPSSPLVQRIERVIVKT